MTDVQLLEATGVFLFGKRWRAPLARELKVGRNFVTEIAVGRRQLPPKQRGVLARMCQNWLMDIAYKRRVVEEFEKAWRDRMWDDDRHLSVPLGKR